jgi:hypothetical protein
MGLDINAARFLLGEKSRGIKFNRTLTLGRQGIYTSSQTYASLLERLGVKSTTLDHADDFFRGIGADPLIAMDASNYEGAEIIHDTNNPVEQKYHSAFDTVIDGGTLEHVFNFPISIKNYMEMVKVGGQLILMTPWHNFAGHGFYQFSPELYHNVLSNDNGYQIERMLIVAGGNWYSVKNPIEIKDRIEIHTQDQILLYISARRIKASPIFAASPQQSDYSTAWQSGGYATPGTMNESRLKSYLTNRFSTVEALQSFWRNIKRQRSLSPSRNKGLTRICPSSQIPEIK